MTKRVFLWTAPRCVSTAFERSIMEMDRSKVFHEPYASAYYFGPERQSKRYKHIAPDEAQTYEIIGKNFLKAYDNIDLIFSKEMAHVVYNHFDEFLQDGMRDSQHTFLIRNPKKTIPSLYAASTNKKLTGWEYFDSNDGGFKQLFELYWFIVSNKGISPIVVDADDLLEDPEGIMKAYCEGIGVRFDRKILKWEARPVPEWDVWAGWHENAMKSSGFYREDPGGCNINNNMMVEDKTLPKIIMQTIERAIPFYEELYRKRISPKSATDKKETLIS